MSTNIFQWRSNILYSVVTKQPSSVLPKIVVPVVLVVLLLLVGSVVLIVGVVYLRKKRARTFTFQRMALSDVEGEEEDDD